MLFHILIMLSDYFAIIYRKQCDYVTDRVYKMFFLGHNFACSVHWTLKQKNFLKTLKLKNFKA